MFEDVMLMKNVTETIGCCKSKCSLLYVAQSMIALVQLTNHSIVPDTHVVVTSPLL